MAKGPTRIVDGVAVSDKVWRDMLARVKDLGAQVVKVGVIGSEAANEREDGLTMGRLAGVHEFGAAIKIGAAIIVIPERSFIRAPINENRGAYSTFVAKNSGNVLLGKVSPDRFLGLLGARAVGDIQKAIAKGIGPENAQSTIDRKGSSKPLIDSGLLRQSISFAVVDADDVE